MAGKGRAMVAYPLQPSKRQLSVPVIQAEMLYFRGGLRLCENQFFDDLPEPLKPTR
jgi:hypothetical protein